VIWAAVVAIRGIPLRFQLAPFPLRYVARHDAGFAEAREKFNGLPSIDLQEKHVITRIQFRYCLGIQLGLWRGQGRMLVLNSYGP